ncbi:MAG: sigma-54-dependent Fis family transcriptional regulator [Candidatus Hydrothermae bacterium]|nr:sigma-54-dependent Fis family transcriptional regulator [Candidatus Hydrothermae bacterium]
MDERILIVDDEASVGQFLSIMLEREGYKVEAVLSGKEALEKIAENPPQVVLADLRMPEMDGIELLTRIKEEDPRIAVVIMTAYGSLESAVEAMRKGAFDYVMKPFQIEEIKLVIKRAIEERKLREENLELKRRVKQYELKEIVGKNEKFQRVLELAKKVAPTDSTVLIRGESGTGKELIAKAIHNMSPRANNPFIAINMAALPEELLESELFGYTKGAFTGATKNKEGLFKAAEGGTILLDEISEASPRIQVKILRALQEKEITPVGSTKTIKVDVRIIASTNADLEKMVAEGRFREDLYYRLNVVYIQLPPLRERKDDIPLLTSHFLKKYTSLYNLPPKKISDETMKILLEYSWPGNVRELENAIERAVILSEGEVIKPADLPEKIRNRFSVKVSDQVNLSGLTLEELERRYILQVLDETGWNKNRAAQILGIDPSTLYRKLQRYGLSKSGSVRKETTDG